MSGDRKPSRGNTRDKHDLLRVRQSPSTSSVSHMELLPIPAPSRTSSFPQLPPAQPVRSPKERFRALVTKVINRNRACAAIRDATREGYSLEQGVDPNSITADQRFGSQWTKCTIEVTHYTEERCRSVFYTNSELVDWLKRDESHQRNSNQVRWINVAGVSWDVIKALSIRYKLHPLSIEDVMASTQDQPFKVDYYSQHLFAQLTSYQLRKDADDAAEAAAKLLKANSSKAFYMTGRAKDHQHSHNIVPTIRTLDVDIQGKPNARPRSLRTQSSTISELGRSTLAVVHSTTSVPTSRSMDEDAVKLLKLHSGALDVVSTRVFVFLLRDGTLLSIHQDPTLYGMELKERLNSESIMRSMADASMLFHGLLDLVADHLITIVDEYQLTILELERSILIKATLAAVQSLHLISGDIRLLKMQVKPLQRIVYGLRRYDRARSKGLTLSTDESGDMVGFLSEETKIYLADIYDHVRFVLLSLDAQDSTTQELIQFTFNLTSYDSGEVMRILLIVSVIFLPLMFITQYFGMNFEVMDSVKMHSEALFWKVVSPVLFALILVALRNRIRRAIRQMHSIIRPTIRSTT